ncbi:MAG: DNA/RNA nuclease SfsA [Marinilabiliaceae bacterium]|nr:DNA/RNA nuclease SfsA [Marinilabiliaceae bacterium]
MTFASPLIHGKLIKRYKRFLADIQLDDGSIVVAHCTNSGSMKSCLETNAEVYLSKSNNLNRKTKFTWEMIKINDKWVGINTLNPNIIAAQAISNKEIPGLDMYDKVTREVRFGESRLDILAENSFEKCAIEVKNVTLKEGRFALFPDAKTERGLKHLKTLMQLKQNGKRAVMLYIIQRIDVEIFAPAHEIDPEYAQTLIEAEKNGVEIFPVQVIVTPEKIEILKKINYQLCTLNTSIS